MFKKLVFLIVLSFVLLGCGSSGGTTEEISLITTIELTADKTSVTADGTEKVTLSAILKDKDNAIINGVDISYYEGSTKLSDNTFKTTKAGTYNIIAKAGNVTSNIITVNAMNVIVPTTIELTADKTTIIADGMEKVTLSATLKDKDNGIINGANISYYEGSTKLTNNIFKTTKAGTYNITARLENIISNIIIITVNKQMTTEQDFNTSGTANNTCEISDYLSLNKEVTIPEKINGKTVTTIGKDVFYKSELISATIPNSVISICNGAFYNNKLTSIIIPDSVTSIGEYAFNKNELTSVIISNSVTSIGEYAFSNNKLTSIIIPNSIVTISESLFSWNKLTSVIIPNSVKSIGESAFSNNELTTVTIPESVTSIGGYAFNKNGLINVTIPNGIITISKSAFSSNKLTNITIPNSVTSIGENAFYLNQLTSVTIPSSVTTIGKSAFAGNKLTSVTIPSSITAIGKYIFAENKLTNIIIPSSVTSIGEWAFSSNKLTSVIIPNSVTSIGENAFYLNQLTSVTIPSSVTIIGTGAFAGNSNLIIHGKTGSAAETYAKNNKISFIAE